MNSFVKYLLIFLAIFSVVLNIVLICLKSRTTPVCSAKQHSALKRKHDPSSLVFADLTSEEYRQVRDYMWKQPTLAISRNAFAKPSENFIFLIDLQLPKKVDVLGFLDEGAAAPERRARVVVFHGTLAQIKEYVVGPLPNPTYHRDVTLNKYKEAVPISSRTVTIGEYRLIFKLLHGAIFSKLSQILKESFGVDEDQGLNPFHGMPRGTQAGDRQTWISFFRDMSGMYIHPVGFEVLLNHRSKNASEWRIEKLLYNGQYFESAEELMEKYTAGKVNKIVYKKIANYASLKPKVKPTGISPQQHYLQGTRFSVENNQVLYLDWSFAFGLSSSTGMRVFDIRFKGERIAYELSVQEAMSVYGSNTPGMILTKFLDASIGIGRFAHELTRGVDCPYSAVYVDTVRYIDIDEPKRFRNSICIFEHDTGRPLRRHFSDFFSRSYGGVVNSVLVFRTITAIGNYDYIWDFMFYQSGSVEAKVHATGYISSSYKIAGSLKHGHQVAENTIGNIHTHFINFKVDLDVLVLNIVLICLKSRTTPVCSAKQHSALKRKHDPSSLVFADLTSEEYRQVRDYMWKQPTLAISRNAFAKPSENFIYLIDLQLPKKVDVLGFLDKGAAAPERRARVVVFHGTLAQIKEYVVGPLPNPTYHRDVTLNKYKEAVPISSRTVTIGEYNLIFKFLHGAIFSKLSKILKESFGVDKDQSLNPFEGMPRGSQAGDRQTWISFFRDMSGMYIHPVGFEVLLNHRSTNASEWRIEKLLYNGQYFESAEELIEKYTAGKVNKIVHKKIANYASLKPKVKPTGISPQQHYLQGTRFSVENNQVLYLDWSFAFGLSSSTGMRVFDIRFKGERIAYELSVQEAMSVYGSNTPGMILTKFLDASIGIGRFAHELTRGVDCPYSAVYVDTVRYIDIDEPKRFRNSICIFEHDTGRPLRRHFSDFFSNSYGGVVNSVLVFRTITAIGNYDYIWDFMFYQSGSVEAKVHATGYISSSYKIAGSLKHGHQVAENTIGNIHTHFINFKVDLDVLGVKNMFQTKDMKFAEVELPWLSGKKALVPHLVEETLGTEKSAALRYGEKIPRYLHIASNRTNRWGHQRSYRLQVISFTGEHLPEAAPEEKSMSWARYKVAITKHKDEEPSSTSLHSQNGMWTPPVDFSTFIEDDERIMDEDLVAWVTTGFLHIPHAEDIPNTVTVGNGGGVILRPHNYFDQDPSVDSPDAVYIHPDSAEQCDNNKMACLAQEACSPSLPPFTYNGFEGVMVFE